MKKYLFMIMATVAMAFTSCEKVSENNVEANDNSDVKIVFDINAGNPDTRSVKTEWAIGDKVMVFLDTATEKNSQILFTYTEDGWTYTIGTAVKFLTSGFASSIHVPGDFTYDSDNVEIVTSNKLILVSNANPYYYDQNKRVLTLGTITLGYDSQAQITIPGVVPDYYKLYIADNDEIESVSDRGVDACFRPVDGFLTNPNSLTIQVVGSYIKLNTAYETGYGSFGVADGDDARYTMNVLPAAATAEKYYFLLSKDVVGEDSEVWEYVVDRTEAKTLKAGSAIKLPGLSSWTKLETVEKAVAEVTVSNPFPGFGDPAKTGWTKGDRLNVWVKGFNSNTKPHFILCYNGSSWDVEYYDESYSLGGSSYLSIVYEGYSDLSKYSASSYTYPRGSSYKQTSFDLKMDDTYSKPACLTAYAIASDGYFKDNVLRFSVSSWTLLTPLKVVVKNAPDCLMRLNLGTGYEVVHDGSDVYLHYEEAGVPSGGFSINQHDSQGSPVESISSYGYSGAVQEGENKVFYFLSADSGTSNVGYHIQLYPSSGSNFKWYIQTSAPLKVPELQSTMTVIELDYNNPNAVIVD